MPSQLMTLTVERPQHATNPGTLLDSQYGVVPFVTALRQTELEDLESLSRDDDPFLVRMLHGPGGVGKTRLLIHHCSELRQQGWNAGFVPRNATVDDLLRWSPPTSNTLLVFDYAETRPILVKLLVDLARSERTGKLRVVLLARVVAAWWTKMLKDSGIGAHLQGSAKKLAPPRNLDESGRKQFFEHSRNAFVDALGQDEVDSETPDLTDDLFQSPLYLSMAALAFVEGHSSNPTTILADTADREVTYAQSLFPSADDDHPAQAEARFNSTRRLLAAITLRGGKRRGLEADRFVAAVQGPDCPYALDALANAYLRFDEHVKPDEQAWVNSVQPDLLGEQIVVATLKHYETTASFLAQAFEGADASQMRNGLWLIDRLGDRRDCSTDVNMWLDRVITIDPIANAPSAISATMARSESTASSRVAAQLAAALPDPNTDPVSSEALELAKTIENETSQESVSFRELRLWGAQIQITEFKSRPEPEQDESERARLLNNLSVMLSELGRREDALQAADQAVQHYRRLAEHRPDAFLPDLAKSLSNLGNRLSKLGRREDALQAADEAVRHNRRLAEQRPAAFLPGLAMSLSNLSVMLSKLGRLEDALQAADEAVRHNRRLAEQRPDAFLPDLAMSLNNLGYQLSELGHRENALQAADEAVQHNRRLAEQRPDAFRPSLAMSLHNLSVMLSELGRLEGALQAADEAAQHYRRLAEQRPDAFLPDLAKSLSNLGNRLSKLDRREDALQAADQAVRHNRRLAEQHPDAFLPDLAASLNNLGYQLGNLGRREDALQAADEAAQHYRRLAEQHPDVFLPDLAMSLNNLGGRLSELGRGEDALQASGEAAQHYRRLAEQRPAAFLPDLAMSLNNLGYQLSELGHREDALQAADEAVRITLELARTVPAAFGESLIRRTKNLTRLLDDPDEVPPDIATTLREAREIARQLGLTKGNDARESY